MSVVGKAPGQTVQDMIENIQKAISAFLPIGKRFLSEFAGEKTLTFPQTLTAVALAERIIDRLQSTDRLAADNNGIKVHLDSIGLLLRPNLLDFMNLAYLHLGLMISEDELHKRLLILNHDQVNHLRRYIKQAANWQWVENVEEVLKRIEERFGFSKLLTAENIESRRLPSPLDIADEMMSSDQLKSFAPVVDQYRYASLIEHYGIVTYHMRFESWDAEIRNVQSAVLYSLKAFQLAALLAKRPDYAKQVQEILFQVQ